MNIAVKSEVDSRVFVYPLLKCLFPYGTIALVTNNPYCARLIEDDYEAGFKNIKIILCTDGDLFGAMESDGFYTDKYDYAIFDNVGAIDYDVLIALVTNHLSESYMNELMYIIDEEKTHIIKFGSPAPNVNQGKGKDKEKKLPKSKSRTAKSQEEEIKEEDDLPNKWAIEKTEEEFLTEKLSSKVNKWCKFPSYESIDLMESRHYLMVPDETIITEVYRLLSPFINVDERLFKKGAKLKDESSSIITGTDVR